MFMLVSACAGVCVHVFTFYFSQICLLFDFDIIIIIIVVVVVVVYSRFDTYMVVLYCVFLKNIIIFSSKSDV